MNMTFSEVSILSSSIERLRRNVRYHSLNRQFIFEEFLINDVFIRAEDSEELTSL